jgi:hypothetical protein
MNDIQASLSDLGLAGLFLGWFVVTAAGAYLGTKFSNIATKQDIDEITNKVEAIRSDYAHALEGSKALHQLRLAAIDKRLQAHQEAFTHWVRLIRRLHQKDVIDAEGKCRSWWQENCIYLEPDVRDGFIDFCNAVGAYHSALQDRRELRAEDPSIEERAEVDREIREHRKKINGFGDVLFAEFKLPKIADLHKIAPHIDTQDGPDAGTAS